MYLGLERGITSQTHSSNWTRCWAFLLRKLWSELCPAGPTCCWLCSASERPSLAGRTGAGLTRSLTWQQRKEKLICQKNHSFLLKLLGKLNSQFSSKVNLLLKGTPKLFVWLERPLVLHWVADHSGDTPLLHGSGGHVRHPVQQHEDLPVCNVYGHQLFLHSYNWRATEGKQSAWVLLLIFLLIRFSGLHSLLPTWENQTGTKTTWI